MSKSASSLLLRLISTAVMLPVFLLVLFQGGWWFFILIIAVMTVATWEYVHMLRRHGYWAHYVFALVMVWAILADFIANANYLRPALAILLFTSLAWHVLRDQTSTKLENWLLPLGGALYIGWLAGHMFLVRAFPRGGYLLFLTFSATWWADSAAYFVGRAWGKHHMAPQISPKKTWEGFAGGIVFAIAGNALFAVLGNFHWMHGAMLGLLSSILTSLRN